MPTAPTQPAPTQPAPTLTDGTLTDTVRAARALARLARVLERGTGELSVAQYRVLSAVAEGDERASRIAGRLALGKPAISATVESLCQRGLLTRSEVVADQRAAALALTAAGRRALAEIETAICGRLAELAGRRPDAEHLLRSLAELGAALDEFWNERIAAERTEVTR